MYDQSTVSDLIRFARVDAGSAVIDVYPGDGDWTRLFSDVVGPEGRVFSFVPPNRRDFAFWGPNCFADTIPLLLDFEKKSPARNCLSPESASAHSGKPSRYSKLRRKRLLTGRRRMSALFSVHSRSFSRPKYT